MVIENDDRPQIGTRQMGKTLETEVVVTGCTWGDRALSCKEKGAEWWLEESLL